VSGWFRLTACDGTVVLEEGNTTYFFFCRRCWASCSSSENSSSYVKEDEAKGDDMKELCDIAEMCVGRTSSGGSSSFSLEASEPLV